MRIGIVLPQVPQYSETFFINKIKGLQESGIEVIVFSGQKIRKDFFFEHNSAYKIFEGKPVKQFIVFAGVLMLTLLKCPGRLIKLFSLERKDGMTFTESLKSIYINAHILPKKLDWLHFGFATMSLGHENTARAIGAKMGVSFRGYDINIYPLKNPGCYNKLWTNIDKVHSISEYLRGKAITLGLKSDIPYKIITPAIDISFFKMKSEPGKLNYPVRILTVGRLNWIKDYETAVSTMKILKENGIEFVYTIIGAGKELERLKFAVYQTGLDDRIFFLGMQEQKEITEKMRESDIYLQTSYQEGFCVSVLEAQATGLLCVVSDADGLKENVTDGVTGWIVQKRKPEKFAEKITEVLNLTDEKRKIISMAARRRVEEGFKFEDQKIKFKKFFTD